MLNSLQGYSLVISSVAEDESINEPKMLEFFISLQTIKELASEGKEEKEESDSAKTTTDKEEDQSQCWWNYWKPRDSFRIRKNLIVGDFGSIYRAVSGLSAHFKENVRIDGDLEIGGIFNSDLDLDATKTLHVNYIDPVNGYVTTSFSGNIYVPSDKIVYTNKIDPASGSVTEFSGNVSIEHPYSLSFLHVGHGAADSYPQKCRIGGHSALGAHSVPGFLYVGGGSTDSKSSGEISVGGSGADGEGTINIYGGGSSLGVLNVEGYIFASNYIATSDIVYTDRIDPASGSYTEFGGDLDLLPTKTLHTNYIDPLSGSPTTTFSGNIHVQGDVSYTGNLVQVSDDRIKKNKSYIDNGSSLDQVMSLSPAQYNFLTDNEGADPSYGLIAQEVQAVMPEAVDTRTTFTFGDAEYNDFLLIKQNVLLTKLLSAFQEAVRRIEVLEASLP
jgi:hypothetical protein